MLNEFPRHNLLLSSGLQARETNKTKHIWALAQPQQMGNEVFRGLNANCCPFINSCSPFCEPCSPLCTSCSRVEHLAVRGKQLAVPLTRSAAISGKTQPLLRLSLLVYFTLPTCYRLSRCLLCNFFLSLILTVLPL
jgi:hypothetical protein